MGSEQSKSSRERPSTAVDFVEKARLALQRTHNDWSEVYSCTLSEWARGHSDVFGFDRKIDYCVPFHSGILTDMNTFNMQAYCTKGYQFRIESISNELRMKEEKESYNLPPVVPRRSSRYTCPLLVPAVTVAGCGRDIALLQVVHKKTKELHFIPLHMASRRALSVLKDIYLSEACMHEAYISPDENFYLLRPNFYWAFSRCADPFTSFAVTKDIKLVSVYSGEVLQTIEDTAPLWHSIAFDPSSGHSKIAIGNTENGVSLWSVTEKRWIAKSTSSPTGVSHHLAYSPNAAVLASLGVRAPRRHLVQPIHVVLYSGVDLTVLHIVQAAIGATSHQHAALLPLFSSVGDYVALLGPALTVSVLKLPKDVSLKHLCRLAVRKFVREEEICKLRLPNALKLFLLFLPVAP